jgi:aryl-alcohol dehydrogenase-like predicted oxidoreductase
LRIFLTLLNPLAERPSSSQATTLANLGTDYVDIYQLHHLNTEPERAQALAPGGAYEAPLAMARRVIQAPLKRERC